ncbi:hypothetical protein [Streptomyces sp. AP-93]|uniref:hypothetical protein n=1 Tax=Streptomyces sp. AP-93 TaxID=2929048 RepID=UPI001FB01CAF|nr:hypothetical protein [Streptomyces sp. AP-93]MCJ0868503.1 hypothetical protein [Streptomyces sp. AP-93]
MLDTTGLRFPLDSYHPTAEQRKTLERAQEILVDRCMERYGFRYPGQPAESPSGDAENARRYGISSASRAASHGYADGSREAPGKSPMDDLGSDEKLVLLGQERLDPTKLPKSQEEAEKSDEGTTSIGGRKVPAGGCLHEATLKLFRPTKDIIDLMFVQNLMFDAYRRSQQDSHVVKAAKSWSDCMAHQGLRTDEPVSPMEDLGFKASEFASPKAISAAKKDIACKAEVNLVGIWFSVETSDQNRLIDQNAETLKRAKVQLEDRLRLANLIIK